MSCCSAIFACLSKVLFSLVVDEILVGAFSFVGVVHAVRVRAPSVHNTIKKCGRCLKPRFTCFNSIIFL